MLILEDTRVGLEITVADTFFLALHTEEEEGYIRQNEILANAEQKTAEEILRPGILAEIEAQGEEKEGQAVLDITEELLDHAGIEEVLQREPIVGLRPDRRSLVPFLKHIPEEEQQQRKFPKLGNLQSADTVAFRIEQQEEREKRQDVVFQFKRHNAIFLANNNSAHRT